MEEILPEIQTVISGAGPATEKPKTGSGPLAILELSFQTEPQKNELAIAAIDYLRHLRIDKDAMGFVYGKETVPSSFVAMPEAVN